jgi:hypothetical protein
MEAMLMSNKSIVPGITIDLAKLLMTTSSNVFVFDPNGGIDGTPAVANGHWAFWGEAYRAAKLAVDAVFIRAGAVGVQGAWRYNVALEMLRDGYAGFKAIVPSSGIYHRMVYDVLEVVEIGDGGMPTVKPVFEPSPYILKNGKFRESGSKKEPHDVHIQLGWCIAFAELGLDVMSPAEGDPLAMLALAHKGKLCGVCMPCR